MFTERIDRRWSKSHSIGTGPIKESIIEPFVGGRWYTRCEDGSDAGVQLIVTWEINAAWKPDSRVACASEIEVRFSPDGPRLMGLKTDHDAIAAVMPRAHAVLTELAQRLGESQFFVGDSISLADLMLGPQLDFLQDMPEWEALSAHHENLRAWIGRINARPSMEATTWERVAAMGKAA